MSSDRQFFFSIHNTISHSPFNTHGAALGSGIGEGSGGISLLNTNQTHRTFQQAMARHRGGLRRHFITQYIISYHTHLSVCFTHACARAMARQPAYGLGDRGGLRRHFITQYISNSPHLSTAWCGIGEGFGGISLPQYISHSPFNTQQHVALTATSHSLGRFSPLLHGVLPKLQFPSQMLSSKMRDPRSELLRALVDR